LKDIGVARKSTKEKSRRPVFHLTKKPRKNTPREPVNVPNFPSLWILLPCNVSLRISEIKDQNMLRQVSTIGTAGLELVYSAVQRSPRQKRTLRKDNTCFENLQS
jgi:hypothetical protein